MRPGLPPAPASLGHWNSGFALVEERVEQGSKVWRYPSKKRSRQGVTVCLNPSTQKGEEDNLKLTQQSWLVYKNKKMQVNLTRSHLKIKVNVLLETAQKESTCLGTSPTTHALWKEHISSVLALGVGTRGGVGSRGQGKGW